MKRKEWRTKRCADCIEIWAGRVLVAKCYSPSNACLVQSAPIMLRALVVAERALLKANRVGDGSQRQNTDTAKCLADHVAPALDAARGKTNGRRPRRTAARHGRTSLPV